MTKNERERIKMEISRLEDLMLNIVENRKTAYVKKNAARLNKLRGMLKNA